MDWSYLLILLAAVMGLARAAPADAGRPKACAAFLAGTWVHKMGDVGSDGVAEAWVTTLTLRANAQALEVETHERDGVVTATIASRAGRWMAEDGLQSDLCRLTLLYDGADPRHWEVAMTAPDAIMLDGEMYDRQP